MYRMDRKKEKKTTRCISRTAGTFIKNRCKKRILCACVLLLSMMAGCSLAAEEGSGAQSKDQLIGGMITREYVEKTYAQSEWDGERIESLTFDGIDGYYVVYSIYEAENGQPVFSTAASEGLDCMPHYKTVNQSQSVELTINAYVLPEEGLENTYYLNPIYMTNDGKIYTSAGNSASAPLENGVSTGWNINEVEKIKGISSISEIDVNVAVTFSGASEPVKIQVLHMDKEYQQIKAEEFLPGQMPKVIEAEAGTEYMVFVTEQKTASGETMVNRDVCSWDGETTYSDEEFPDKTGKNASLHFTDCSEGKGFLLKQPLWVIWGE